MSFAEGGAEALEMFSRSPFDVVISDLQMPGMSGPELLTKVSEQYPHVVRIVLSGTTDTERVMQSLAPSHQYLSKPCEPELLKAKLAQAFALRDLLTDDSLKGLLGQIRSLPSLPTLYTELMTELHDPEVTMVKVGEIISKDLGMTAKILQLVNSVYFGLGVEVASPVHAAKLLGLDIIRALVLSFEVFSQFDQTKIPGLSMSALLDHSQTVGAFAKTIYQAEDQDQSVVGDAFMAGILHDAGKLVLASNFAEQYNQMAKLQRDNGIPTWEAEHETFGATHAEVGAYLLGLWGLPDSIVEALAFHHRPQDCLETKFGPLTAVHVANVFEHELHEKKDQSVGAQIDEEYLSQLGLSDHTATWRTNCHKTLE